MMATCFMGNLSLDRFSFHSGVQVVFMRLLTALSNSANDGKYLVHATLDLCMSELLLRLKLMFPGTVAQGCDTTFALV